MLKILDFLAPARCLGCEISGGVVCVDCRVGLGGVRLPTCPLCNAANAEGATCAKCAEISYLGGVHVARHYDGLVKQLVGALKYDGERAAARELARLIAPMVAAGASPPISPMAFDLIVPIPSSPRHGRQRGYNPASLIARELARQTGLPYLDVLGRLGATQQVGQTRTQRLAQIQQQMYVRKPLLISGARILVVDDVTTTGATLGEAARALNGAGANTIWGAVAAKH